MDGGMKASAPLPAAPRSTSTKDRTRLWAAVAAVLFVPMGVVVGALVLASERTSRCMTYGEQCASGLPGWLFAWSTGVAVVALLVALAAPAVRIRKAALATQVGAEGVALLVILSQA